MTDNPESPTSSRFNRRTFIAGAAGSAVAPLAARGVGAAVDPPDARDATLPVSATLKINGTSSPLTIDAPPSISATRKRPQDSWRVVPESLRRST